MNSTAAVQHQRRRRLRWLRLGAAGLAVVALTGAVGVGSGSLSFAGLYLVVFLWWIGLPQALHMVLAERLPQQHRLIAATTAAATWCAGGALAGALLPFYGASRSQGALTTGAGALIALTLSTAITGAIFTGTENDVDRPVSPRAAHLNRQLRLGVLALTAVIIVAGAAAWIGT